MTLVLIGLDTNMQLGETILCKELFQKILIENVLKEVTWHLTHLQDQLCSEEFGNVIFGRVTFTKFHISLSDNLYHKDCFITFEKKFLLLQTRAVWT